MRLLKLPIMIFAPFFIVANVAYVFEIWSGMFADMDRYSPFLIGIAIFVMFYFMFFRRSRNYLFIETFEHETLHTVFGLLFFRKIQSFVATDVQGGAVNLTQPNFIIVLAPYVVPSFVILFMLLKLIVSANYEVAVELAIGLAFGFHVISSLRETHLQQTDLQINGLPFSFLLIISAHVLTLCAVPCFITGGIHGFFLNLARMLVNTYELVTGWM